MARFRHRPVETEAVQWTGDNRRELEDFAGNPVTVQPDGQAMFMSEVGSFWVARDCWLVRRTPFTTMDDAEFTASYEPVD